MLFIYIELRYLKQLQRIAPSVPASFFSEIADSVLRNGGEYQALSSGSFCFFDEHLVGSTFAAARVLDSIRTALEKNRKRIREYFVLTDIAADKIRIEALQQELRRFEQLVLPDEGLLITSVAGRLLAPYITVVPDNDTGLLLYSGQKIALHDSSDAGSAAPANHENVMLYPDPFGSTLHALRNCVGLYNQETLAALQDGEENQRLFHENRQALEMFGKSRFSAVRPAWQLRAIGEYYRQFFTALNQKVLCGKTLLIIGTKASSEPLAAAVQEIVPKLKIEIIEPQAKVPADIVTIPTDLRDLAYLAFLGIRFLFIDEMPAFFKYLGKQSDFMEALADWLYSYGLLYDKHDFRSFNFPAMFKLEASMTERSAELRLKMADYLRSLSVAGVLEAGFEIYDILVDLGCQCPDSFLLACIYRSSDPMAALAEHAGQFSNRQLYESARLLETAREKYESGLFSESAQSVKRVLHVFQQEKSQAGEFRALSLLGMLTLAQNSDDDAIVYLEYALENAEAMKDTLAILATRLDMATVWFIQGNYHFALCALERLQTVVSGCYAKDREVLIVFLKGRIRFELGDYRGAETLFESAAAIAANHEITNAIPLCRVWYARSLLHQNRFASAENILVEHIQKIPDAHLFLLESRMLSGREGVSLPANEDLITAYAAVPRWNPDNPGWESGFALAEDRCYGTSSDKRLAVRMLQVFSIYGDYRIGRETSRTLVLGQLDSLARAAMSARDPYAALYYYLCYEVCREQSAVSADTTTYLSRAFKYLQKRSHVIDNNSIREQYMQQQLWNGKLFRAARDNMLI